MLQTTYAGIWHLKWQKAYALGLSVFFLLVLPSTYFGMLYWQAYAPSDIETKKAVLLRESEHILFEATKQLHTSMALAGKKCEDVKHTLAQNAGLSLNVRSLTLMLGRKHAYCSSLFAERVRPSVEAGQNAGGVNDGHFYLSNKSPLNKATIILRYNFRENGNGAIVSMSTESLKNALTYTSTPYTNYYILLHDQWINSKGEIIPQSSVTLSTPLTTSAFFPELSIGTETTPYIAKQVFVDNLKNLLWVSGLSFLLAILVFHAFNKMNFVRYVLNKAIRNKEFVFFLQPIMDVKQKKCSGMEALIRWQHPRFGTIAPQYFLQELIHTKLLAKITTQLINVTAEDMNLKLKTPCYLSINVEPSMFENKELIDVVKIHLSRPESKHIALVLELTERGFHQFTIEQKEYLDELRELGVSFALDDFGTGKSNLSHITQIKFEYLKIDISFITAIGHNDKTAQMLDSIIELGHKFGLTLIAEGIQTEAQRDYLLGKKVYLQQGFLFAHAMDSEGVSHFMENTSLIQA